MIHIGSPDADEIRLLCREAEVVLVEHSFVPDVLFRGNDTLREIVFMGTGAGSYTNLSAAEAAGVNVSTVSRYGDRAVAEHTIALMFAGARQIAQMDRDIRGGVWTPLLGRQLQGRKLTVLGLGGVGRRSLSWGVRSECMCMDGIQLRVTFRFLKPICVRCYVERT
jgi:D-3-phosphoglycerate dehydrogenase